MDRQGHTMGVETRQKRNNCAKQCWKKCDRNVCACVRMWKLVNKKYIFLWIIVWILKCEWKSQQQQQQKQRQQQLQIMSENGHETFRECEESCATTKKPHRKSIWKLSNYANRIAKKKQEKINYNNYNICIYAGNWVKVHCPPLTSPSPQPSLAVWTQVNKLKQCTITNREAINKLSRGREREKLVKFCMCIWVSGHCVHCVYDYRI